jgi:HPt (histidine-containing phosphotransfer) domain-containing protein
VDTESAIAFVSLMEREPERQVLNRSTLASLRELAEPGEIDPYIDFAQVFLWDSLDRLRGLETSLENRDLHGLSENAHALKGSSGNIGADQLATYCTELEDLCRKADWASIPRAVATIKAERWTVMNAIERELGH